MDIDKDHNKTRILQDIILRTIYNVTNEDFTRILSKQLKNKPSTILVMTDADFSYKQENIQETTRREIIVISIYHTSE